jgi:hypothetical protein
MNIKIFTGCVTALCLLAATAVAAQDGKGVINTLNLDIDRISVNYEGMTIDDNVRIQTVGGSPRTTDHLAERQHVSYTLNKWGRVSEIRIYDSQKLMQQGFYTADEIDELNH